MNTASPSVNWQAGFLSLLPAVEDHARIKFRKLRAERREEAIQEAGVSVPDLAAFRIDFPRWLQILSKRDYSMVSAFIRGEITSVVADRFGLTWGRVSQLRRRYEQLWGAFHGELTGMN